METQEKCEANLWNKKSENISNSSTEYLPAYQTDALTYKRGGVSDWQHVAHDGGEDGDGQHDGYTWAQQGYGEEACTLKFEIIKGTQHCFSTYFQKSFKKF